jgi:hypothetical protein
LVPQIILWSQFLWLSPLSNLQARTTCSFDCNMVSGFGVQV